MVAQQVVQFPLNLQLQLLRESSRTYNIRLLYITTDTLQSGSCTVKLLTCLWSWHMVTCTHTRTHAHTHACTHARTHARTHTHTTYQRHSCAVLLPPRTWSQSMLSGGQQWQREGFSSLSASVVWCILRDQLQQLMGGWPAVKMGSHARHVTQSTINM